MGGIVFSTDLSPAARQALPLAQRLVVAFDGSLLLLHVVHAPLLAPAFTGSVDLDRRDAEQLLAELAAELGAGVRTRVVEAEDVAKAIVREAAAASAALLVMASHGRSGLQRLRLGSVVEAVLESATVPVLCVPAAGPGDLEGSRVVVATDLSDTAARAFPVARQIAGALGLPMTLLVVDEGRQDLARLGPQAALLAGDGGKVATEVVAAPRTSEGLVVQARLDDAVVLCTAAAPKSTLQRLLLGSVSLDVVRSAAVPVVVVPA